MCLGVDREAGLDLLDDWRDVASGGRRHADDRLPRRHEILTALEAVVLDGRRRLDGWRPPEEDLRVALDRWHALTHVRHDGVC